MKTRARKNTYIGKENLSSRESHISTDENTIAGILLKSLEFIGSKTEEQMLQFGNWFYNFSDEYFREDEKKTR